jgi:regulatory protein
MSVPAGTITQLTVQQRHAQRVSVFLDGTFAFGVSVDLMLEFGLRVGRQLSLEEQEHLKAAERLLVARAKALQYLAYRPRTAHEVRQKLRQSGFEEEIVTQVMERLQARGDVNDAAYAQAYLKTRLDRRGEGPQRIRRDLQRRGIHQALLHETLQQCLTAEDMLAAARTQAARRWPRLAREADPAKRRKKLGDFLYRRGFPYELVQQVMQELED